MATVMTTINMIDQFSRSLERVNIEIRAAFAAMDQMATSIGKFKMEVMYGWAAAPVAASPQITVDPSSDLSSAFVDIQTSFEQVTSLELAIPLQFDVYHAMAEMEQMKQQMAAAETLALPVGVDSSAVDTEWDKIENRIRSDKVPIVIDMEETQDGVFEVRDLIEQNVGNISTAIDIRMPKTLTMTLTHSERLVKRISTATERLGGATNQTRKLESSLQRIADLEQKINDIQEKSSSKSSKEKSNSGGWMKKLWGYGKKQLSVSNLKKGMAIADDYMNTQSRFGLINDGSQTVDQLQDKVFAAANRSRGNYKDVAGIITQMGMSASSAFGSNDELIAFTELMHKSYRLGGASDKDQQSGMQQIAQAMASGKLQGDGLKSIMNNAPMLAQAIADFTGKSKAELSEMATQGEITADIIKGALFAASDDINNKFNDMPVTFGDIANRLKNSALQAFGPVIEQVNKFLNSDFGRGLVNGIVGAIGFAAEAVQFLIDGVMWVGSAFEAIWPFVEPVLAAIGGALTFWATTQIPALISQLGAMATKLWALVKPVLVQAGSWLLVNWPILLIGAAIGFLIYSLIQWQDITAKVIGVVTGIFGMLVAHVYNNFVSIINFLITFAEFFENFLKDPVYALKKLFYDLVIDALATIKRLANGIETIVNKITGKELNLTAGLDNVLQKLEKRRDSLTSDKEVTTYMRVAYMEYEDAYNIGEKLGQKGSHWVSDKLQQGMDHLGNMFGGFNQSDQQGMSFDHVSSGIHESKIDKVGEVGKIRDTVDISSKDLKTMRELAEMKNIQNFVTLTPAFSFGDMHVKQDGKSVDEIIATISDKLNEAIASGAKGVYG